MKMIKISEELHQALTRIAGKKQLKTGKRVTFEEVIKDAVTGR